MSDFASFKLDLNDYTKLHAPVLNRSVTGYGKKVPTAWKIKFDGRLYRVYCRIYSNSGTCYIVTKQHGKIIVD